MERKITYSVILISVLIIIILIRDGCNSRKASKDFENRISNFELKEQKFKKIINKQGKEILEQNQMLVTMDQATQQDLLENTKLKKIISQVSITTNIKADTLFIDFVEDDWDDIKPNFDDIIRVPKSFSKFNEWYGIEGEIVKEGIRIDSIKFFNQMTITIGDKKLNGFKNIFKKRDRQIPRK